MSDLRRRARACGLALAIGWSGLVLGAVGVASAQAYLPDGPNVPVIRLNESQEGAAGLPALPVPPPNGWNQQSIWNMKVVGFNDNQGRPSSDDGWIENQNGRYILYMTDSGGSAYNPMTHQTEPNGTSLIDVTHPDHPVFLHHIPSTQGSSSHVAVCGGSTLPHGTPGKWYMLRHDGSINQEIWDVTDPTNPVRLQVILSGLNFTHHDWWECDTGIAYLIAGSQADGWYSGQHVYIYDISNPYNPVFIRQWGLVGQQPTASKTAQSCYNDPTGVNGPCYEGVTNPTGPGDPEMVHQVYSAGTAINRVYMPYGVSSTGVFQILDRNKLLNGCNTSVNPAASTSCANSPSQADLLYPQISYTTTNPNQGGHTSIPIFGVPIPQAQQNFLDGTPQKYDLLAVTSEDTTNDCLGQPWKNPQLLDITNDLAIWPISSMTVGQFPGNFCAKGSRFGSHELNREIYAPYYGKIIVAAFFNAGLQVFDVRDPYNPRRVAYFIQAPNANTQASCGTYQGDTNYCRKAIFSDLGEVDDRGYIYNLDRAGSGLTVLKLTGDALDAVATPHVNVPSSQQPVPMPPPLKE
ncbi:MAG TPA: hypothetical protein VNV18_19450 [Stellaceae bacterium]|nr:hypothetical protein [Stellaceae bacterium]